MGSLTGTALAAERVFRDLDAEPVFLEEVLLELLEEVVLFLPEEAFAEAALEEEDLELVERDEDFFAVLPAFDLEEVFFLFFCVEPAAAFFVVFGLLLAVDFLEVFFAAAAAPL